MAVTNLLKTQVDQPVFEWVRFAPTATSVTSALAATDDLNSRYMYYVVGQALWRYDTYSDSWQELAPPPTAPLTAVALKYAKYSGYRGHAIAATSNTITIAGFGKHTNIGQGLKIRIVAGKGAGQERTITQVADAVVADFGVATTASATTIGDSTKKWRFNQWDGYQCRLVYNTGQSQVRKILYNDTTTLTFSDTNHQAIDSFNNTGFSSVSPYAIPVTTAGSQTHFIIESSVVTVDSAWDVTPDGSSIYMIVSGGLWLLSSASSTPFSTYQFYDILSDTWYTKTPIGGHLLAAIGTDFAIDRTGEVGGAFISGVTATSATARTLVNSGATLEVDRYANHQLRIVSGTGVGQRRRIVGHGATAFYVEKDWAITPDSTSGYAIYGDTDKIWLNGNGSPGLFGYSVEGDIWSNGHISDWGIARNISATPYAGASYEAPHPGFGVSSIVRTTSGIVSGAVNAAGTNYVVGDLVTCSTSGTNGTFYVTSVGTNGAVTGLQLAASGSGYSNGSSNTTGGSGSSLTITLTVGTTALVTTATNHDFRSDGTDQVKIAGCATDTSFNAVFTILGVGTQTSFSIAAPSSSASPTAANSQSTTVLVDAEKNWATNEHTGKIIYIQTAGVTPTLQSRRITSNTANTITVPSILTAATNGTSRYVIQEVRCFGAMMTNKIANKTSFGWATSGTATTLVDSTKNWNNNQWINCKVRVVSGTGIGNESTITANTATTLTVASWGVATPDDTSKYEILETYGVVTTNGTTTLIDANKNWTTNSLAGKVVRITAGFGSGNERLITSNTATVLTLSSQALTDTTSVYVIYEIPARSTGTSMTWLFGLSDIAKKGRYLISARGGASNIIDFYDIPSNTWDITPFFSPMSVTLSTGSMYTYDGADSLFLTKDNTGRIYELDLDTMELHASGITPYAHSTAIIGNRMEVLSTADGLKYLYVMRHTGQEMWRTLKFW